MSVKNEVKLSTILLGIWTCIRPNDKQQSRPMTCPMTCPMMQVFNSHVTMINLVIVTVTTTATFNHQWLKYWNYICPSIFMVQHGLNKIKLTFDAAMRHVFAVVFFWVCCNKRFCAIVYVDKRLSQESSKYRITRLLFDTVDWQLKAVGSLFKMLLHLFIWTKWHTL